MTIQYKGQSRGFNYRIAEIFFDEDNAKETKLAERIANFLEKVEGYKVDCGIPSELIIVVENHDEYEELVKTYKEAKKMFRDCMKYGF